MPSNLELQQQELMPLKNFEETQFVEVLKSKLIKESSIEDLKKSLRMVMLKVGLRANNIPDGEEKLILINHVIENFGGNTVDEIKLAFDMAIAGKLNLDDVKCYENFSCMYFSMIMGAYRKWAAQVYRQVEPKVIKPPPQKILTQQELDNEARGDAEWQYQMFLKGMDLKGLEFNSLILIQDGLIGNDERVIDFFTRRAKVGATNIYVR